MAGGECKWGCGLVEREEDVIVLKYDFTLCIH